MKETPAIFKGPCVRSAESIKQGLLRRAFAQGRGEDMQQKIDEIEARVNDMPEDHVAGLALAQYFDEKCGTSRTLRSLSLRDGRVYEDTTLPNRITLC